MTFKELKDYFDGKNYRDIAKTIGVSPSQLTYYKKHGTITKMFANVSHKKAPFVDNGARIALGEW